MKLDGGAFGTVLAPEPGSVQVTELLLCEEWHARAFAAEPSFAMSPPAFKPGSADGCMRSIRGTSDVEAGLGAVRGVACEEWRARAFAAEPSFAMSPPAFKLGSADRCVQSTRGTSGVEAGPCGVRGAAAMRRVACPGLCRGAFVRKCVEWRARAFAAEPSFAMATSLASVTWTTTSVGSCLYMCVTGDMYDSSV